MLELLHFEKLGYIELLDNEAGRLAIKSKSPITQQMLVKVIPKPGKSFSSKDI